MDEEREKKKGTQISDLVTLHDKAITEFKNKFWISAEENKRYRKGDHWSDEEKAEISSQDLIDYSLPIAETKLTVNISQQMATRSDLRCLGRGPEDEINAEIKTTLLKFVDDDNDFEHKESDCYADGIGKKYGVIKRYTDYSKNAKGRITLNRIPLNQVMWDLNCKDYNVPKYASWMQEMEYISREQLSEIYPNKKDIIDRISDSMWSDNTGSGKDMQDWFRMDRGLQMCKRVIHYQRRYKTIYSQYMSDGSVENIDDSEYMNAEYMNETNDTNYKSEENYEMKKENNLNQDNVKYTDQGQTVPLTVDQNNVKYTDQEQTVPLTVVKKIPRIVEYIEAVVFIKEITEELNRYILGYTDNEGNFIESDMHCLHPYFSFFDDGDVICLMDLLKQPQRFIDRITMQIDRSMSKMIKSSYTVIRNLLEDQTISDWDEISTELTGGGALMFVKDHNAIRPIVSGIINPELFTMWKFIYQVFDDVTGGKNNVGVKETSGESGVAVRERKEAAVLVSYLYVDNLRRWKKTLGEGLMENIDEVYGGDQKSTFRILGDSMSKDVLEILEQQGIYKQSKMPHGYGFMDLSGTDKPLGETKVDIIISRAASTPHLKEQKLAQLMAYYSMKAQNGEKTPPISLFFALMDIDPTVKLPLEKWEKEEESRRQAEMELRKKELEFKGHMAMADQSVKAANVMKPGEMNTMQNATLNNLKQP